MMTDLFEKSIATLELPRVLEQLAACASTQEGKERCLALRPMTDPDDVQRAQEETSAAVKMLILRGSPGFSGVKPVGASLHRADMGGSLNTRELLEVAAVLRCARTAKEYGDSEEKTPISHLFHALTPNRFLEDTITNSIVGEDELADSASSELASIRRHIRATEAKVRDILQRILASNQSKYLQESIITIRSDRYVVPVKSEHKNAIPGLVHDVSASGSTFFIEPMGVVKANNELRELMAQEKKEIERILADLSAQAAAHPETAQAVARIKALRQTIDNIDSAVIALLAERFKATSQVGVLKANAGFAPEDTKREDYQIERLHRIAIDAGLDPEIAEMYREFVVTEAKKRHQRIADAGGDPGVLDVFA